MMALPLLSPSLSTSMTEKTSLVLSESSSNSRRSKQQSSKNNNHNKKYNDTLNRARRWIYISHASSQFSEAVWQFALILFLAALSNYQSLFLVSSYGVVTHLSVCCLGTWAGRLLDNNNNNNNNTRLTMARWFLVGQNTSVLLATACCYLALKTQAEYSQVPLSSSSSWWQRLYGVPCQDVSYMAFLIGIHILGPTAQLLDGAFCVAMERDWIVCMAATAMNDNDNDDDDDDDDDDDETKKGQVVPHTNNNNNGNGSSRLADATAAATAAAAATPAEWLATTNVVMKQIDLASKVVAPAVSGWIVGLFDDHYVNDDTQENSNNNVHNLTSAALLVGLVNFISLVAEYVCTERVYYMIPALQPQQQQQQQQQQGDYGTGRQETVAFLLETIQDENVAVNSARSSKNAGDDEESPLLAGKATAASVPPFDDSNSKCFFSCLWAQRKGMYVSGGNRGDCSVYFQQPLAWGGLGLALLYVNALTFGALMTAYLVWRGMSLKAVGLWRGVSSALGLLGTLAFYVSVDKWKLTLIATDWWSICYEFACLTVCLISFTVSNYFVSITLLIASVCASRIGLWVFDISITQLMQEFVPAPFRGEVGGTQQSLNALFQLLSFCLGLVFPNPADFWIYAVAGYLAVGLALLLYFVSVYQRRHETAFLEPAAMATAMLVSSITVNDNSYDNKAQQNSSRHPLPRPR